MYGFVFKRDSGGRSEFEFYNQDLCINMIFHRSAQEFGLFFLLMFSYCELNGVLATCSLLIVQPVVPYSVLRQMQIHGRTSSFV